MVSFISIALVIVKLKILVLRVDSAFIKWLFLGGFGLFLPKIYLTIVEILTRGSTLPNNNIVWKNLKDSNFHEKETDPKFALLVQL